jgi:hypothetical protein
MGRPSRRATTAIVLAAVAAMALVAIPAAIAAFGARTQNEGDTVTAAADFTPPAITATVVAKSQGGITGYVRKGGAYFVYANVSADTGNPASGLATVKGNVTELTGGQTGAALTAGSFTAGGVTYNFRSAELTATATVEGAKTYSVIATDNAGNASTLKGTATVDNVAPTAADVQTANGGTTVGLAEAKDSITYTFSEPIDPQSILAGWNGTATNVVVRMVDNGLLGLPTGNDELFIYNAANTATLPFGAVNMGRGDYVAGLLGGSINFGASGTRSTMVMSGNTVTVTFGTEAAEGLVIAPTTAAGTAAMTWTPVATPYDRAGNVMSTTPATQSGAAHKNF